MSPAIVLIIAITAGALYLLGIVIWEARRRRRYGP
jgi:hypothetical protein